MSDTDPTRAPLGAAAKSQLQSICDAFALLWDGTEAPRIETFVDSAPAALRESAFQELLAIELSQRQSRGEPVSLDEYLTRFPDRTALVRVHFQSNALVDTVNASMGVHDSSVTLAPREPSSAEVSEITSLGDYEIVERIAQGGMGVVYKAVQPKVGRTVALKTILSGQFATPEEIDRFFMEAEAAAALDHSGIVPVYEAGECDGRHYFSMAFVEGESLADRIREQPLPNREAARILIQVAEAVQYAHEHGVVHRDLKPANILIDRDGRPRITDFGLAKNVHADRGLTASGEVLGTPSYMSPEQAGGVNEQIGPATDIYALGAVLYALLTGRPPFQAPSVLQTLAQVLGQEPVPPRSLNQQIDRDLDTICLKALEKDIARRYPSAASFAAELERYLRGEPIVARPIGRVERAWRWSRRNRGLAILGASTAILLLALAIGGPLAAIHQAGLRRDLLAEEQRRSEEQLGRLRAARIAAVPGILADLDHDRVGSQLQLLKLDEDLTEEERLRVSLALLEQDDGQVTYLKQRLLAATAEETLVVRDALLPYRDRLADELWAVLREDGGSLNAAAALAVYEPDSERWERVSPSVAEALLQVNPSQLGDWVEALLPVRMSLLPHVQSAVRDSAGTDLRSALAADVLAIYAADLPEVLIDGMRYASASQFETLLSRLDASNAEITTSVERVFHSIGPMHWQLAGMTETEFQISQGRSRGACQTTGEPGHRPDSPGKSRHRVAAAVRQ